MIRSPSCFSSSTFDFSRIASGRAFLLAALYLMLLTFAVHGSALFGWWRWDDPEHLIYSFTYSPNQYFFDPEIWRLISPVNFTPLLSLSFYVDLSLFGVQPFGFYLHHLISLGIAAIMSLLLFELWLPRRWALLGVTLFLLGMPTFVVAQQLMSRHYIEGLALFCAALYLFVVTVRQDRPAYAWLGGICYLLAMLCKEIYAPLIGLLFFLPEGSLKQRCRFGMPFLLAALFYIGWRLYMLDAPVSGYSSLQAFDFSDCLRQFADIPQYLLGGGWLGAGGMLVLLAMVGMALWLHPARIPVLIVALLLLLLPLVPLTIQPGLSMADGFRLARFLFLLWWGICALAAWSLFVLSGEGQRWRLSSGILLAVILWATLSQSWMARGSLQQEIDWQEVHGRFVWEAGETQMLMLPQKMSLWYCRLLSDLRIRLGEKPPFLVVDEIQLDTVDMESFSVSTYDSDSRCIVDISAQVPALLQAWRDRRVDRPLEASGYRSHRFFSWRLGPYTDGQYSLISNEMDRELMMPQGDFAAVFDIDLGVVIVRHDAPDGRVSYSLPFRISADGIEWLPEHVMRPER